MNKEAFQGIISVLFLLSCPVALFSLIGYAERQNGAETTARYIREIAAIRAGPDPIQMVVYIPHGTMIPATIRVSGPNRYSEYVISGGKNDVANFVMQLQEIYIAKQINR